MKRTVLISTVTVATLAGSVIFISCTKPEPTRPSEALQTEPELPAVTYRYFEKHGVNDNLATLGRVLFYDKNLSVNNAVSCGSCHKQEFAFADNVRFNKGFNGIELKRNSPSIQGIQGFIKEGANPFNNGGKGDQSTGYPTRDNQAPALLFWDGRQNSVADMVLNPVLNHNEMSMPDFESLISKLETVAYYPALFKKAYGDEKITQERVAFALEGFMACLNTDINQPVPQTQMPNDHGFQTDFMFEDPFSPPAEVTSTLTGIAEEGRKLFHNKYNCAKCHDPQVHNVPPSSGGYNGFTPTDPSQMFNIGLDEVYADNGLGALTKREGDKGLFKVPTLKNISVTGPYMHDGRFTDLGQVIDHYSHGIQGNRNLSKEFTNTNGTVKRLNILPNEKKALIAFLNTLKDEDFLTNPMYSDPFSSK